VWAFIIWTFGMVNVRHLDAGPDKPLQIQVFTCSPAWLLFELLLVAAASKYSSMAIILLI
jgi:hypothetical protein